MFIMIKAFDGVYTKQEIVRKENVLKAFIVLPDSISISMDVLNVKHNRIDRFDEVFENEGKCIARFNTLYKELNK